jgi:hypothetical protein
MIAGERMTAALLCLLPYHFRRNLVCSLPDAFFDREVFAGTAGPLLNLISPHALVVA